MMSKKKTEVPEGERKQRARNPWPVESDTETSVFGGSRTIGGGFGFGRSCAATKPCGFGGFGADSGCAAGGFGVIGDNGFGFSSRSHFGHLARGAAVSQSESAMACYPRGTSRRARTTRRNGRRGRGPNNHCYHCGEHGHFSKVCPKKEHLEEDEEQEEQEPLNSDTFIESPAKTPSSFLPKMDEGSRLPAARAENGPAYNAKLENQKARESYYNAFGYSAATTGSLSCPAVHSAPKSTAVVDKFSEELDNALKMSGIEKRSEESDTDCWESRTSSHHRPDTTPPTVATQSSSSLLNPMTTPTALQKTLPPRVAAPFGGFGKTAKKMPAKSSPHFGAAGDEKVSPSPSSECELLTIETRRSVMRDGEYHFEEQTIISFPRNLPDNVRVITAQFLPVQNAK